MDPWGNKQTDDILQISVGFYEGVSPRATAYPWSLADLHQWVRSHYGILKQEQGEMALLEYFLGLESEADMIVMKKSNAMPEFGVSTKHVFYRVEVRARNLNIVVVFL